VETGESLTTGYGDATPSGDNLLNDFARGEAEAFGALARARGDRVTDDADFEMLLADGNSPTPFGNVVALRRPLSGDEWPAAVERMHQFFAGEPGGPFIVFAAWPTPDLQPHDFGRIGHPPVMLRPAAPLEVPSIPGFSIRRVDDAAGARDWEFVMVHGYPVPELQPFEPGRFLPEHALSAPGWHHYVGYLDDAPVATGSAFLHADHVHIEFISAVMQARGRGIGYAITAAATATNPNLPALLIASDLGRPVYDRLGYLTLSRHTLWAGHRRP
jgi:hypothetical protein